MEEESLQFAGDVIVEEISLLAGETLFDMSNFFIEFNLYEDVFSPTLHGDVVISDSANVITELPMIGTELLYVKFRTPTLDDSPANLIEKTFQIYSITDRKLNNDRSQFYALNFMSLEAYVDNGLVLSQTFSGNTDELATQMFDKIKSKRKLNSEDFSELIIYDTPHASEITYTTCYWSPIKNLSFIGKRVRGNAGSVGTVMFYESNKGFYFASLEALINFQRTGPGVFDEYVYELVPDSVPRFNPKKYGNNFPSAMTRIEQISIPKVLDIIDGQDSGYYGSVVRGYDIFSKKMSEVLFDARTGLSAFTKTDSGNPIPGDVFIQPSKETQFVSYNSGLYNGYGLTSEDHSDKVLFRRMYLNSFNQFKFEVTIPGRTDIEVGMLISINYPAAKTKLGDETDIDDVFDPLISGNYLISAIHHTISSERHVIRAEIIKNGLLKDLGSRNDST